MPFLPPNQQRQSTEGTQSLSQSINLFIYYLFIYLYLSTSRIIIIVFICLEINAITNRYKTDSDRLPEKPSGSFNWLPLT